jgi:subtilisin family serine protease
MKNILSLCCILFINGVFAQTTEFANNRLIVEFNNLIPIIDVNQVVNLEALRPVFENVELETINALDKSYSKSTTLNNRPLSWIFKAEVDIESLIIQLEETGLFNYVEPDFINRIGGEKTLQKPFAQDIETLPATVITTTPNDPFFFLQWGFNNNGSWSLSPSTIDADVDMIEAWDLTTGNPNITMAVIDSGIRMTHPEFSGRLKDNTLEILDNIDNDGNGYIDDINGWDFVNNDAYPTDDHGHGTNVTGIAVATGNNGIGYAGVDWSCKILPLKALDSNNSGFNSNFIESIYYAVNNGAKIISISIGSSSFSTAYETAINVAYNNNVVVVACMMNFNNGVSYYPAAFQNTIAVGSTDPDDERSSPFFWSPTSGSNFGQHLDVVAPGNYIYGLNHNSDTNYNSYWGGTSQATPLVSGICSLMLSINPNLTVDQIKAILRSTAEDQVGGSRDLIGWDFFYGAGRVNAYAALQETMNTLSLDSVDNTIRIFPNPVSDNIVLSSSTRVYTSYKIVSLSGQIVMQDKIVNGSINCSALKAGLYILQITDGKDAVQVKKFIKI